MAGQTCTYHHILHERNQSRLSATPHSDEMNDKDAPFSLETEAGISKIDYFKQYKKKSEKKQTVKT